MRMNLDKIHPRSAGLCFKGYRAIAHVGNDCFSLFTPLMVAWVSMRLSDLSLLSPLRCSSPPSVISAQNKRFSSSRLAGLAACAVVEEAETTEAATQTVQETEAV